MAGEQFLHGALFDLAFFGDELLQGFDEGIRIGERLGDGFLFGFGGGEGDYDLMKVVAINAGHTTLAAVRMEVNCPEQIRDIKRFVTVKVSDIKSCVQRPKIFANIKDLSNSTVAPSYHAWTRNS